MTLVEELCLSGNGACQELSRFEDGKKTPIQPPDRSKDCSPERREGSETQSKFGMIQDTGCSSGRA